MSSILRLALPEDVAEMSRVRYSVYENKLPHGLIFEDDYLREMCITGRGWLIEQDGEVVAFAVGNAETGNIWALFVQPEAESRGYGRRLHDEMVRWLWSCGLKKLWLTTGAGTRAKDFYAHLGWVHVGQTEKGEMRFELYRQ